MANNLKTRQIQEDRKKGRQPKVYNIIKREEDFSNPPSGQKYTKCSQCGKQFEQMFYSAQNRYSDFKICPSCRRKNAIAKKQGKKEIEETVATLPFTPFPWQKKALQDFEKCRFMVIAAGNRAGKDRMTVMTGIKYFVECLSENRHIDNPDMVPPVLWWQIAPTEKMAKQNWRELKKYMPKQWVVACSDSTFTMETIGGGIIEVRSAYDPEALVGVGLDLVTITEAARIAELPTVWANIEARLNSPGRGRAVDRKGRKFGLGKAIINSSPIGKNYFYDMYKFGQPGSDEYSSNWISYKLSWRENPYMDELADQIVHTKYGDMTYEEDLRRKIGDRLYRQNYLADFLAIDGTVFKDFEEKCVKNLFDMGLNKQQRDEYAKKWVETVPYHSYRIGYDPATGSSTDTPAVVVRDMDTNQIVMALSLYGKNYDQQWDEIGFISRRYNYAPCTWLRTGHTAVENQLAKRGVVEIPLDEQAGKKSQYIQSLERAVQNGDVHVLNDGTEDIQTMIMEMNDYSEKGGKYSNESQPHDDFVSAMYAVYYDYSEETNRISYCPLMGTVNRYT